MPLPASQDPSATEDFVPTVETRDRMSPTASPFAGGFRDAEVQELSMLLPRWQVQALEASARRQGLTTGQMLRRMITELISENCELPVG